MEHTSNYKALFISVAAGFAAEVTEIARSVGAKGATIINARAIGAAHHSIMGITVDTEREIILMLIEEHIADDVMDAIKEKAGRHTPAHSICFTASVDKVTEINNFPAQPAQ